MKTSVLAALARRYQRSEAGRTGEFSRDLIVEIKVLLDEANISEGDDYELAMRQLRAARAAGILELIPLHKRDPNTPHKVRFSPANEVRLYESLNVLSPAQVRAGLAEQFAVAASAKIPGRWQIPWQNWCEQKRAAAMVGRTVEPFDRHPSPENAKLLALLPKLLDWEGESLVRFVSCNLCGDSKMLESLAPRDVDGEHGGKLRGKLGRWLEEITGGDICTLNALGILPNPRSALVHGPLRLRLDGTWLDLGLLQGFFRISLQDLQRAEEITTTAQRCLTVENEASFHELAKLRSDVLLIQTSFPGQGTLKLLKRLPDSMGYWHFGDSDDAGFQILEALQKMSGRPFKPLHMQRGRVSFEQEALGFPGPEWPFYPIPGESR